MARPSGEEGEDDDSSQHHHLHQDDPIIGTMLEAMQNVMAAQFRDLRRELNDQMAENNNKRKRSDELTTAREEASTSQREHEERADEQTVRAHTHMSLTPHAQAAHVAHVAQPMPAPRRSTRRTTIGRDARPHVNIDDEYYVPEGYSDPADATLTNRHTPAGVDDGTPDRAHTDAITELLAAAGTALGRKQGKSTLMPNLYVIRGDKREKVGMGEATLPEYVSALCRMAKAKEVPTTWRQHLIEHVHQLSTMAQAWEWETCRLWSERVFTMMDDGRLPRGWADIYAIKDVQRDAIAVGNRERAEQRQRQTAYKPTNTQANTAAASTSGQAAAANAAADFKSDYNRETDGKPCHQWNWGNDCGNSASHGQHPDRKLHICAWCANKYHRTNPHQEKACNNKRRFQDKKATQTATDNSNGTQGFL